jgi:hypothetical protein
VTHEDCRLASGLSMVRRCRLSPRYAVLQANAGLVTFSISLSISISLSLSLSLSLWSIKKYISMYIHVCVQISICRTITFSRTNLPLRRSHMRNRSVCTRTRSTLSSSQAPFSSPRHAIAHCAAGTCGVCIFFVSLCVFVCLCL